MCWYDTLSLRKNGQQIGIAGQHVQAMPMQQPSAFAYPKFLSPKIQVSSNLQLLAVFLAARFVTDGRQLRSIETHSPPCLRLASRSASLGSVLRLRTRCSFQRSPLRRSLWSSASISE